MIATPIACDLFWTEDPMPVIPPQWKYDCDGLVSAVRKAMAVSPCESSAGYEPYYGYVVNRAAWYAKYVMREARRLGLYPTTAQLEAELRRAA